MQIKIKYQSPDQPRLEKITQGCWIDMYAAETISLSKGEFKLIPLGVAMAIPAGWEAILAPRSSTYKRYHILQANSIGIIDGPNPITKKGGYVGDDDWWMFPAYATEATIIDRGDRICQFRLIEQQPLIDFKEVETLNNNSRGGFGSTGVR